MQHIFLELQTLYTASSGEVDVSSPNHSRLGFVHVFLAKMRASQSRDTGKLDSHHRVPSPVAGYSLQHFFWSGHLWDQSNYVLGVR